MFTTPQILAMLKDFRARRGEEFGIEKLGLFGSCARGEQREQSDIDICIKINKGGLMFFYGIQMELEKLFNQKIDLISLGAALRPLFKKELERDAIYV